MKQESKITPGVYLVIDPSMEGHQLFQTLEKAVSAKPCAIQIWDNFQSLDQISSFMCKIKAICSNTGIPILINNHPEWAELFDLHGVHFDELPSNHFSSIPKLKEQGRIIGITVNNDFDLIKESVSAGVDYLSFCSIFPSSTANSCDLVDFNTVKKAREITLKPIFLAGGISPENIDQLHSLDFDGIAVVSGVMSAANPEQAILEYQQQLTNLKK